MAALTVTRSRPRMWQRLFLPEEINTNKLLLPDVSSTTASLSESSPTTYTTTGPSTITMASNGDQIFWSLVSQTTATEVDKQMHVLMMAAHAHDIETFIAAYRSMGWDKRDAEDHAQAVRLALQAGAHLIAREHAQLASDRFPDHIELQKMARILAPPKVKSIPGPPDKTWAANRAWLQNNREAYRGSWVALKNGELLAVAGDLPGLSAIVGPIKGTNILVTPIW